MSVNFLSLRYFTKLCDFSDSCMKPCDGAPAALNQATGRPLHETARRGNRCTKPWDGATAA